MIAGRLSEDFKFSVLAIEEGPHDDFVFVRAPAGFVKLIGTARSRIYETNREPAMLNRKLYLPQGRGLGGGGTINAMIYIRGDRGDYDGWRDLGCFGWGYDDVLPFFKKAEGNYRLSEPYHGVAGPHKVSDPPYFHPFSAAIVRAAQEIGIPYNHDFNGESQLGFGYYQATIWEGERCSAARFYLKPALSRSNLALRLDTRVDRIVFEGRRATGVVLASGATIAAGKGVVLTAGALLSLPNC